MARTGRTVGRCTKIVNGVECGGTLKEKYVEIERGKRLGSFVAYDDLVGYVCEKCGDEQPLAHPFDLPIALTSR